MILYILLRKLQRYYFLKGDKSITDDEQKEQRMGISGGFLSSIIQSEGMGGGIRLNLTTETIQSIFRTYPTGFQILFE